MLEVIQQLGVKESSPPCEGVNAMRFGKLGEIDLPTALREIYEFADGIKFESYPGQMIPFDRAAKMPRSTLEESVYEVWPFFLANYCQSDPISVIVIGPGKGYVMQSRHDGFDRIIATSVAEFFETLANSPPSEYYFDDEEESWIFPRELTDEDRTVATELLSKVMTADDPYEGESMASLAMSMMTDNEFVEQFKGELFPIVNFRAIVWGRFMKIDSPTAREMTAKYAEDYASR